MSLIRRRNFGTNTLAELPESVQALGRKASQYATALAKLDQLGSPEAHSALIHFVEVLSRMKPSTFTRTIALKRLQEADACPVDIDPQKRWKMDKAGRFALELLLWLWCARRAPSQYGIWGEGVRNLPDFNIDTARTWWHWALGALTDSYRRPQTVRELRKLATSRNSRASAMAVRNDIIRKIRDRFQSFARPL